MTVTIIRASLISTKTATRNCKNEDTASKTLYKSLGHKLHRLHDHASVMVRFERLDAGIQNWKKDSKLIVQTIQWRTESLSDS